MKTLIICLMLMGGCSPAWAWTNEQIADAIYKAEGGEKTAYPYGIKSIDTKGDKEYAKKICLNTIRNQRVRHSNHSCGKDYITCLGDRYCPPTAHKLNVNWVRNVLFFLQKGVNNGL